jgi:hypothetical protein
VLPVRYIINNMTEQAGIQLKTHEWKNQVNNKYSGFILCFTTGFIINILEALKQFFEFLHNVLKLDFFKFVLETYAWLL